MKIAQRHQKKVIRAVYPNSGDKRGYHIVLTMQDAKRFAIPYWLTKWAGKLTPRGADVVMMSLDVQPNTGLESTGTAHLVSTNPCA